MALLGGDRLSLVCEASVAPEWFLLAFGPSCLGASGRFRAGFRQGYPVATAVLSLVSIVVARASISRFAEAIATWSWFRFFARPR